MYKDLKKKDWLKALKISEREVPNILIIEGCWEMPEKLNKWRKILADSKTVRHFNMLIGKYKNKKIGYACTYGAPMTSEIVDIFGKIGTRYVIQIGYCGATQEYIQLGDIILPDLAIDDECASKWYSKPPYRASKELVDLAIKFFKKNELKFYKGKLISISAMLAESIEDINTWKKMGLVGVDLETSTTFAVAKARKMKALSILQVLDSPLVGKLTTTINYKKERTKNLSQKIVLELIKYIN